MKKKVVLVFNSDSPIVLINAVQTVMRIGQWV